MLKDEQNNLRESLLPTKEQVFKKGVSSDQTGADTPFNLIEHCDDELKAGFWTDEIKPFKPVLKAYRESFSNLEIKLLDINFEYSKSGGILGLFKTHTLKAHTQAGPELKLTTDTKLDLRKLSSRINLLLDEYLKAKEEKDSFSASLITIKAKKKIAELILKIAERIDQVNYWQDSQRRKSILEKYIIFLKKIKNEAEVSKTLTKSQSDLVIFIYRVIALTQIAIERIPDDSKDIGVWLEDAYDNLSNIASWTYSVVHSFGQLVRVPYDLPAALASLTEQCKAIYMERTKVEIPADRKKAILKQLIEIRKKPTEEWTIAQQGFLEDFGNLQETSRHYTPEQYLRELIIKDGHFYRQHDYSQIVSEQVLDFYRIRSDPSIQEQLFQRFRSHVLGVDYCFDIIKENQGIPDDKINLILQWSISGGWIQTQTKYQLSPRIFPFIAEGLKTKELKSKEKSPSTEPANAYEELFQYLQKTESILARLNTYRHVINLLSEQIPLIGRIKLSQNANLILQKISNLMHCKCVELENILSSLAKLEENQFLQDKSIKQNSTFTVWFGDLSIYRQEKITAIKDNLKICKQLAHSLAEILSAKNIKQNINRLQENCNLINALLQNVSQDIQESLTANDVSQYKKSMNELITHLTQETDKMTASPKTITENKFPSPTARTIVPSKNIEQELKIFSGGYPLAHIKECISCAIKLFLSLPSADDISIWQPAFDTFYEGIFTAIQLTLKIGVRKQEVQQFFSHQFPIRFSSRTVNKSTADNKLIFMSRLPSKISQGRFTRWYNGSEFKRGQLLANVIIIHSIYNTIIDPHRSQTSHDQNLQHFDAWIEHIKKMTNSLSNWPQSGASQQYAAFQNYLNQFLMKKLSPPPMTEIKKISSHRPSVSSSGSSFSFIPSPSASSINGSSIDIIQIMEKSLAEIKDASDLKQLCHSVITQWEGLINYKQQQSLQIPEQISTQIKEKLLAFNQKLLDNKEVSLKILYKQPSSKGDYLHDFFNFELSILNTTLKRSGGKVEDYINALNFQLKKLQGSQFNITTSSPTFNHILK